LERILRKIEKFCGTFGFSAEDLDFLQKDPKVLQKIGKFFGGRRRYKKALKSNKQKAPLGLETYNPRVNRMKSDQAPPPGSR
jgi:hypothetical protein